MATPPDFSVGQVLTAAQMDAVGLWLVKTQTVGNAVSTQLVSDAFSTDFISYRIVIENVDTSVNNVVMNMTISGSTGSTYSTAMQYQAFSTGVVGVDAFRNNSNLGFILGLGGTSDDFYCIADIHNPFEAKSTSLTFQGTNLSFQATGGGRDSNTASSASFTIAPASGTMTGGTIRVYGYRK